MNEERARKKVISLVRLLFIFEAAPAADNGDGPYLPGCLIERARSKRRSRFSRCVNDQSAISRAQSIWRPSVVVIVDIAPFGARRRGPLSLRRLFASSVFGVRVSLYATQSAAALSTADKRIREAQADLLRPFSAEERRIFGLRGIDFNRASSS